MYGYKPRQSSESHRRDESDDVVFDTLVSVSVGASIRIPFSLSAFIVGIIRPRKSGVIDFVFPV